VNNDKHKFKVLKDPFTFTNVEIDSKLVSLISSLWNKKIGNRRGMGRYYCMP